MPERDDGWAETNPDAEDLGAEVEEAYLAELGITPRPTTTGEVSIYKWARGDPARAMRIADSLGEQRGRILARTRLVRDVYAAKKAVLDAWLAEYEMREENEVARIDNLFNLYQQDFHPNERTTALSSVVLSRRADNKPRREWVDENAALRYQQEHWPEDVRQRLDKPLLVERLEATPTGDYVDRLTGEIVSFVRDVPPEVPERFTVKQVAPAEEDDGE